MDPILCALNLRSRQLSQKASIPLIDNDPIEKPNMNHTRDVYI